MAIKVAVVSTARTPFTRAHKGELKDTRPDTMGAWAIKEALARAKGVDPAAVEDVVLGCAMPEAEQGMNVARLSSMLAGLPETVPSMTINRFCSSGVQSIATVAQSIGSGAIEIGIAGGTETMTMIPIGGIKVSANAELMEKMPQIYTSMGATAELVAKRFEISRQAQDEFAFHSQRKAAEARAKGTLKDEIFAVKTKVFDEAGHATEVTVSEDTILRADTTLDGLAKLKPAFDPKGTVTAGNASPLTDGAAAVVLMTEAKAKQLGLQPLGYFIDLQVAGVPPEIMGIGPVPAVRKLLQKNGLSVKDIDVVELNEAFASQALYCIRELGLDPAKVNPNGGAIALGHPLGVSGTRMTGALLRELKRRGGRYGIVTMCIGGGMGAAALFQAA